MDSSRRLLLAFALMAAVLFGSQYWASRTAPPPEETAPADSAAAEARAPRLDPGPATPAPATPDTLARAPGDTLAPADSAAGPAPAPGTANDLLAGRPAPGLVLVETPLYRAWLDPRGGALARIDLVGFPSFTADSAATLVPEGAAFLRQTADLGDETIALDALAYAPGDSAIRLAEGDSARTLAFTWRSGGRTVTRRWSFSPSTYVVDARLDLEGWPAADRGGVLVTRLGPRLRSNEVKPKDDYNALRAVARVDGEIVTTSPKDVEDGPAVLAGEVDWAGLRSKYFLAMVLAPEGGPGLTATTVSGARGDSLPDLWVDVAAPIDAGVARHRLYIGPQEYRRLAALNDGLDEVNQYGWSWIRWMIAPFAKMIVVVMLWLHQYIPSWGLVLVVFAVLVRIVLWPLTVKSYRSIREMQKLQPEIQKLRERYKSDPQRMQQETMRLYKERKVNPLGGCLPNLLPMPILFALFFVFQSSIELRGAPFLWLPDLSQPDPWYVLPVFMGATMILSTRLTVTDPKQTAMTWIMPIVLTFVFLNLAAGLVLYYAISNVLTFAQQWWMKRAEGEAGDATAKA